MSPWKKPWKLISWFLGSQAPSRGGNHQGPWKLWFEGALLTHTKQWDFTFSFLQPTQVAESRHLGCSEKEPSLKQQNPHDSQSPPINKENLKTPFSRFPFSDSNCSDGRQKLVRLLFYYFEAKIPAQLFIFTFSNFGFCSIRWLHQ